MPTLPDEVWLQVLDYLSPEQILPLQRVTRHLSKLSHDSSLWRAKCFEKAPSAAHAMAENGATALSSLLDGLTLQDANAENSLPPGSMYGGVKVPAQRQVVTSKRARAIADWDCTDPSENTNWYSEYVARHAPLSTEWMRSEAGNEIRSMASFPGEQRILSAMEDGSLRIFDIKFSIDGRRKLRENTRSSGSVLLQQLHEPSPSQSSKSPSMSVGSAVDSTLVAHDSRRAYVATHTRLSEIDLETMRLISQEQYAWPVTAISQQSAPEMPLMVGTSFSLHMHDPRLSLKHRSQSSNDPTTRLDVTPSLPNPSLQQATEKILFLPNYYKTDTARPSSSFSSFRRTYSKDLNTYASIEPGPQTILHRNSHEIIIAGRMPSILFYDIRTFPKAEGSRHSGARLSSLALINSSPVGSDAYTDAKKARAPSSTANHSSTLIAAGEYHGRGSLELYELPRAGMEMVDIEGRDVGAESEKFKFARYRNVAPGDPDWPATRTASESESEETNSPVTNEAVSSGNESRAQRASQELYSYKNRQTTSSAKLLAVATQGTRIVFSDSEGALKWVERDGRGLARRWNINTWSYDRSKGVGAVVGESVVRKMCTLSTTSSFDSDSPTDDLSEIFGSGGKHETRGDGDLLVWTGSDIGIITSKPNHMAHDELIKSFEDMQINGKARRELDVEEKEMEYSATMRRALERQADERRWMSRFGGRRG